MEEETHPGLPNDERPQGYAPVGKCKALGATGGLRAYPKRRHPKEATRPCWGGVIAGTKVRNGSVEVSRGRRERNSPGPFKHRRFQFRRAVPARGVGHSKHPKPARHAPRTAGVKGTQGCVDGTGHGQGGGQDTSPNAAEYPAHVRALVQVAHSKSKNMRDFPLFFPCAQEEVVVVCFDWGGF